MDGSQNHFPGSPYIYIYIYIYITYIIPHSRAIIWITKDKNHLLSTEPRANDDKQDRR